MSSVIISGDTSGAITVSAPAVSGTNTLTLQAATATNAVNKLETAITLTTQTAPDFTSIPSWVKKITIGVSGLSTNGGGNYLIQGGSGSYETSGYLGASTTTAASASTSNYTTGFGIGNGGGVTANIIHGVGILVLVNLATNTWAFNFVGGNSDTTRAVFSGGSKAFSGTLDRIRFFVDGTQQFDAGTINLLLEG